MKNSPHKFADVIKAWADGLDVEFRYGPESPWRLYANGFCGTPDFCDSGVSAIEWRIKPEPVLLKYRRFIRGVGRHCGLHVDTACEQFHPVEVIEKSEDFLRWVDTEWQTVEL